MKRTDFLARSCVIFKAFFLISLILLLGKKPALAQSYSTLPYSTGFETGVFDASWTTTSSNGLGRVQVTTDNTPNNGSYHITMDVNASGTDNTNEAWLHLNLSYESDVDLEFYWKDFGDESSVTDGIYFSDNGGTNFTKVYNLPGEDFTNNTWNQISLDLDALAAANGLTLSSTFVVKFQQFDNNAIATDGFAFDDIAVQSVPACSPTYVTLPYTEGFETGTFGGEWCANSLNRVKVSTANTPRTGSYHMIMDPLSSDNYTQNEALLHLDLSGETQVEMEFYWKDFGDETDGLDGIYFSDDGGSNFVKVADFNSGSFTNDVWKKVLLDIDNLAAANGLALTGTFVIKLQEYDNYPVEADGYAFDDLSIRNPVTCSPTYATLPYTTGFETGSFGSAWCTNSASFASSDISGNNSPVNGNYHLLMDAVPPGNGSVQNEAALHLNLSGETNVELEFYWKDFADATDSRDGIYFSENGGSNFTKVYNLDGGSFADDTWQRLVLDVDNLATVNGLSLTSTFVIKFQQYGSNSIASDGFAFDDIRVEDPSSAPTYASIPYSSGFETGKLGPEWCLINQSSATRAMVTNNHTPYEGNYHLTMEANTAGTFGQNEAALYLNLSGETELELEFYWKDFGDETHTQDGIYFSDDGGSNFIKVYDLQGESFANDEWQRIALDLDNLASVNGLSLSSTFVIKFQQYDDRTINTDGFAFDLISVQNPTCTPVYASIPYNTGFESGSLGAEWCVNNQNSNTRTLVTNNNTPYEGNYHLTMEANIDNTFATNEASLYLDLSGETNVEMEFYWKEFNDETHTADGIYFSDDGGSNYIKVYDLNGQSYTDEVWNHIVMDLDALAAANGLALNSTFVVKFQQYDNYRINNDGFAFDNIEIRNPASCTPVYATLPYNNGFESGSLGPEWCTGNTDHARAIVTDVNAPNTGGFHLTLDTSLDNTYATSEASLYIDFTGYAQAGMSFYWKDFGDETDAADGIYFSDDGGSNFTKVYNLDGGATTNDVYNQVTLDIDNLAALNGLVLNSTFVIKFQQYDNRVIGADGFAFDDIKINSDITNWTGNISTNWNVSGNWDNGVPDCDYDAIIPDVSSGSNNFPIISEGANGTVGNITIHTAASLSIADGRTLNICGSWDNSGNVDIGAGTVTFIGSSYQDINGTTEFQNLTVNNTGPGLRLISNQTVKGSLTLTDGIVDTQTNTLVMGSGSAANEGSAVSYVDGLMTKIGNTDFVFPLGDGPDWGPLGIANLTGSTATEFTAEYIGDKHLYTTNLLRGGMLPDLNNVSVMEYWNLTNSGIYSECDVILYWKNQSQSNIDDYDDLVVAHYNGSGWENMGQSSRVSSDPGSITITGVTSFSPFTFGSINGGFNPLPVKLLSFTASEQNGKVLLNWQTAGELNNDFFEVQRSKNGTDWELIGEVDGNGTINHVSDYSYTDQKPPYGPLYYRLRQVDFDGQFEYSPVQSVNLQFSGRALQVSLYPNPTTGDNINIRLITTNDRNVIRLRLIDFSGKVFLNECVRAEKFASVRKIIPCGKLQKGVYVLEVAQNNIVSKPKIIIL